MSAGAEWNRAGLAERRRLVNGAWSFLDRGFVNDQLTKRWEQLDLELQKKLQRAWTEAREAEVSEGDSAKAERLNADQIIELVQRDDCSGLCLECGNEAGGVEPDARRYKCECCGAMAVYGAEELLVMTQS